MAVSSTLHSEIANLAGWLRYKYTHNFPCSVNTWISWYCRWCFSSEIEQTATGLVSGESLHRIISPALLPFLPEKILDVYQVTYEETGLVQWFLLRWFPVGLIWLFDSLGSLSGLILKQTNGRPVLPITDPVSMIYTTISATFVDIIDRIYSPEVFANLLVTRWHSLRLMLQSE